MKTFKHLKFKTHSVVAGGRMASMDFDNGYGVSVVGGGTGLYGNGDTSFELAVLKDDKLCYDTPITKDVLGWLSKREVTNVMKRVQAL